MNSATEYAAEIKEAVDKLSSETAAAKKDARNAK